MRHVVRELSGHARRRHHRVLPRRRGQAQLVRLAACEVGTVAIAGVTRGPEPQDRAPQDQAHDPEPQDRTHGLVSMLKGPAIVLALVLVSRTVLAQPFYVPS